MKKVLWSVVGVIAALGAIGVASFLSVNWQVKQFVAQRQAAGLETPFMGGSQDTTRFGSPTHAVVTALTSTPVKVLTRNSGRQYASIQNDGTADVYIYLGNFDSGTAASTTVLVNTGIRLGVSTTPSNTFVIDADNLYYGDVWVATTTANQRILTTVK